MNVIGLIVIGVVIIVPCGLVLYSVWQGNKDAKALKAFGIDDGWTYTRKDSDIAQKWSGFPFNTASLIASHILQKHRDGVELLVFTLAAAESGSSSTHDLVGRELPEPLPIFGIRQNSGSAFGASQKHRGEHEVGIDDDAFSTHWSIYVTSGEDESTVRTLLTPEVRAFLTSDEKARLPGDITFAGSHVFMTRGKDLLLDEIAPRLNVLDEIVRRLPS